MTRLSDLSPAQIATLAVIGIFAVVVLWVTRHMKP